MYNIWKHISSGLETKFHSSRIRIIVRSRIIYEWIYMIYFVCIMQIMRRG